MRWRDLELVEFDGVIDYASAFARLAEGDHQADTERRQKAADQRQKKFGAANKAIQAAAASDATPGVKAAKISTQNARKREADATFRAAVAEGAGGGQSFAMVTPPRGKVASHYDAAGKLAATTEWRGGELVTTSASGLVMCRTVIR